MFAKKLPHVKYLLDNSSLSLPSSLRSLVCVIGTGFSDGPLEEHPSNPWFGSINRHSLLFSNQVNRITSKLQTKIHEVTDLRVELEQLLKIVLQIQSSNSANDEQLGNCEKTFCT